MWSCSFWTLPHRGLSLKDLPLRNTPDSFCRRFTRQNFSPVLQGGIFLYGSCTLKISWADRTWYRLSVNAAAQTGAGTSFGANGDQHTRAAELSTYFCVLTIRKHLLKMRFERSGRGQEPSRGHKFSILENVVLHRDFTSTMRLHFRSDLVGACLPQTLLMVRTWRCEQQRRVVLYITSPRSYRTDRRYNDQNECSTDP